MPGAERYIETISSKLEEIGQELPAIREAAKLSAQSISRGAITWVFGGGHSAMIPLEAYPRIGGVLGFVPIVELGLLHFWNVVGSGGLEQAICLERLPGYAQAIHTSYNTMADETIIIFSSSGLEVLPLEMADVARARGLKVVAVTSVEYSLEASRRRNRAEKLMDKADVVIDNCVPAGDAAIAIEGLANRVGPTSSILNFTIMNCLTVLTAELLIAKGADPLVFSSPHFEDGKWSYEDALDRFRSLLAQRA